MSKFEEIEKAETDVKIELPEHPFFQWVRFDHKTGKPPEYCWTAQPRGYPGLVFPMKNTNYVKTFKTLAGAKRNFIRRAGIVYLA